jgi:glycosyltransferase involved in cell wall biosynthesis
MKTATEEVVTPELQPSPSEEVVSIAKEVVSPGTVSVVIPTLNEAGNIPYVLNTIPSWVHEVVIVDGRSTDDTERIARLLHPGVKVVHELTPGKGAALRAGLYAASGDYLIVMDADGSMDGMRLQDFREVMDRGAQFVKGSRFIEGGGSADITRIRALGDAGIRLLLRVFFGARYSDATYGYFAVRSDCRDHLNIDTDGFESEILIVIRAYRSGLRIAEVPCFEANRIYGNSNLSAAKDGLRIAVIIMREKVRGYRAIAV